MAIDESKGKARTKIRIFNMMAGGRSISFISVILQPVDYAMEGERLR